MHSQSSLLQIFFTSELPDMEVLNGIFHLPQGGADTILALVHSEPGGHLDSHDAGISVIRALGAFWRFRDRSSHRRAQKERGIRIKLQGQPFVLLIRLHKQQGELVTREERRRTVWPGTPPLISTTAWARASTNFARCWEIGRQSPFH
jgi:hypothetical protein